MTTIAVQEFLNKVVEDKALQAEIVKAMEAENERQAVTDLAESQGYDFTPEELSAEVLKRQAEAKKRLESGELSDEELEAVAGGELIVATIGVGAAFIALGVGATIGAGFMVAAGEIDR